MTVYAAGVVESKSISDTLSATGPKNIVMTSNRINRLAMNVYTINWAPDVSGAISGLTVELSSGWIQQVAVIPGTGAAAPTAGYKLTLLNSDGFDVLLALGNGSSGLSATVPGIGCPLLSNTFEASGGSPHPKIYIDGGSYAPTISGAGQQALGKIIVYISDVMG